MVGRKSSGIIVRRSGEIICKDWPSKRRRASRMRFMVSHPSRNNKNAARVGHPNIRLSVRIASSEVSLAASAGGAAAHAAVAGAVADHDGSAGRATGGVAHLVHLAHGFGGVVDAAVLECGPWDGLAALREAAMRLGSNAAAAGLARGRSCPPGR